MCKGKRDKTTRAAVQRVDPRTRREWGEVGNGHFQGWCGVGVHPRAGFLFIQCWCFSHTPLRSDHWRRFKPSTPTLSCSSFWT